MQWALVFCTDGLPFEDHAGSSLARCVRRRAGTAMQNVSACAAGIASHTPVSLNSCGRMSSTANVSTGSENTSTYDSAVFSVA